MPTVKHVEAKNSMIERFEIRFMMNGVDVKGNKENIPQWPYSNQSKNSMTV